MRLSGSKSKTLVGLDIEAGSVAVTELAVNGTVELTKAVVAPLAPGLFREGEVADAEGLGEALGELFSDHKLSKQVRVGLASPRVAVRPLVVPEMPDAKEQRAAILFKAQENVPMPLDQAVLDFQVVEHLQGPGGERQVVALAVAARRDMVGKVLEAIEAAGLRPVGIDLSAFGMIRALAGERSAPAQPELGPVERAAAAEAANEQVEVQRAVAADLADVPVSPPSPVDAPAWLYCNFGEVTGLAVARGSDCLFTRVATYGVEGIAQRLAERRQLSMEHARQWLVHVGLGRPIEEVDGDPETLAAAREVLEDGVTRLVEELRVSLEFYAGQERARRIAGVTVCGSGSAIPGLCRRLETDLGLPFDVGRPAALAGHGDAEAARLTLSYGLALDR